MLLSTKLCKADLDTILKRITHVYYLVTDYKKLNSDTLEKVQKNAILLWEEK